MPTPSGAHGLCVLGGGEGGADDEGGADELGGAEEVGGGGGGVGVELLVCFCFGVLLGFGGALGVG